ncbi:MAG: hypothetical protein HY906_26365, partial [Deltaproteobacteria bacterium]|nr:hypothetical protein [Deltaproteobacteria bacterium]
MPPLPPAARPPPAVPPATPHGPAAPAPADDAIALVDADVIEDQVEGAGAGARPAWPEVDTPPMGSDLAALDAAAAQIQARAQASAAREAGAPEAVEPVETDEGSEPSTPAEPAEAVRGERAFRKVDTVPEAPVGGPPPVFRGAAPPPESQAEAPPVESSAEAPPVEERRAEAAVVLAVFDAFGRDRKS